MCGISGFFDSSRKMSGPALEATVQRMADRLTLRGPDSSGIWVDPKVGLALGHRRLAVIDLSSEGHQPMRSESGRYIIVFNGEIYNHQEMRRELENTGHTFRGHSDTEVLLSGMVQWGIEETLQKSNGMFAFALWDRETQALVLARDRLGEKPLYYGWSGKTFLFASELKSLTAHPAFEGKINRSALALYMRHNYIPAPFSIYEDIYKLKPASFLTLCPLEEKILPEPIPYWSFRSVAQSGIDSPFEGSEDEALDYLEPILKNAVKSRMEADVPLGAFLSGGIDSSTVVALMQAQSDRPVKTFTIGFHERVFNEAKIAKKIAEQLGTEHRALYVRPEEAMAAIPKLPQIYDEPFGDVSQIPTYLVSQLARRDVTVSLSGDGADEIFSGYRRYFIAKNMIKGLEFMPFKARQLLGYGLEHVSALPLSFSRPVQRMADILSVEGCELMYREMISHVNHPECVVRGGVEPETVFSDHKKWLNSGTEIQKMMYLDTQTYLPDDILAKVDRASMAVSLESRMPFLDHRLIEAVWKMPMTMNVKNGQGKHLLRKILSRYLEPSLFDRPKMGFGVPIESWLRGPLRDWAEDLLNEKRIRDEGYLDSDFVRRAWQDHLSEKCNRHYLLWTILMFQAWFEENSVTLSLVRS